MMTFADVPLCGGSPRNDEIVAEWVHIRAARRATSAGPDGKAPQSLEAVTAERVATLDPLDPNGEQADTDRVWVGFQRDEEGLFVRGANVRAHLKDCAGVLAPAMKAGSLGLGSLLNFRAKFVDAIYVAEDRLHLLDMTDKPITEPSGYRDATMNVMTARGPRTCLKRVDYVFPARIVATLQVLEPSPIEAKHVRACLEYGAVHGFGQDRSLQFGRYTWMLE
jgi:hypothetical protein